MADHYSSKDSFRQRPNALLVQAAPCAIITDYESLLCCLTEDGRLWWLLKNALRLGAGWLPVRGDNLAMELRAPNYRALVNERTLIDAFDDARLTIERPVPFERDGDCYVDVEGFLGWLSQYIAQTQAEITFPNELVSEVKRAKAKAAASPPMASQEFESLTLAFEHWFDKNLGDLPETLRQRVERDFFLIPWDNLSADQRRSLAHQLDYQHDPATEQERQFWWGFFARRDELQAEISKWKSAATPTASDISVQESRLKELQQEFEQMESYKRQARGDYYPERKSLNADKVSNPAITDYIAYPKALKILRERWKATLEELAAWIFLGQEEGGIAAYLNANELSPPPRFSFAYCLGCEDYLSPLMACWFRQDDIDRFEPADRYITGTALIERWSKLPGLLPEAFIRAKIAESRLQDIHPIFGGTAATFGKDNGHFPPLSAGLFAMSHIEQIEAEDDLDPAPVLPISDTGPAQDSVGQIGGRPKGPLPEAVEMAYHQYTPSVVKREARKLGTLAMYETWKKEYRSLKKKHPDMSDSWCSQKIAKMPIAKGRDAGTIRKNMKK